MTESMFEEFCKRRPHFHSEAAAEASRQESKADLIRAGKRHDGLKKGICRWCGLWQIYWKNNTRGNVKAQKERRRLAKAKAKSNT